MRQAKLFKNIGNAQRLLLIDVCQAMFVTMTMMTMFEIMTITMLYDNVCDVAKRPNINLKCLPTFDR